MRSCVVKCKVKLLKYPRSEWEKIVIGYISGVLDSDDEAEKQIDYVSGIVEAYQELLSTRE